jgi:GntR family transcriptional regulator
VQDKLMKIDHDSAIPFYIQLREMLEAYILGGELQPGDRLPPEQELCKTYDVSRTVVRQTLQEMENKGLIIKRRGKGSFVAKPKIRESLVQKLTGFHQDMVEQGLTPRTEVLHHEVEPAKAAVAMHLDLKPGTPVFNIERLRFVKDEPIVLVRTYLPYTLCPGLADVNLNDRSLYAALEDDFGLMLSYGQRTIEAVVAGEREAKYLGVNQGSPLIVLESVSFLHDGTPIEYFHAFHRGDRSRFVVNLLRVREPEKAKIVVGDEEIALPNSNNLV